MRIATSLVSTVALGFLLSCQPGPPPTATPRVGSVQELSDSLIYATEKFCVPAVVDGARTASLHQRLGGTENHVNVHGTDVTSYQFDRPGSPQVTPSARASEQDYCRTALYVPKGTDRFSIVATFLRDLRLEGRPTNRPHETVICISGQHDAVIMISDPNGDDRVFTYVQSDATTLAAEGCAAHPQMR